MGHWAEKKTGSSTLPETNSKRLLKIGLNAPLKANDRFPTIHFRGVLLVSWRGKPGENRESMPKTQDIAEAKELFGSGLKTRVFFHKQN